ncbi:MAG: hypothetical protein ACPG47_07785 [Leucothrix sp.]
MKILDELLLLAGGYSNADLAQASAPERRQILQLGSAVIFSIVASMISWSIASTHYLADIYTNVPTTSLSVALTTSIVLFVSLSINRNLIFYSDMYREKKQEYSYSSEKKETARTLPCVRVALVVIVSLLNLKVFETQAGMLVIAMLGIFELYPLFLKKQMGQTIFGLRMQEKLHFHQKRSRLKGEEYAQKLKESERKIHADEDESPSTDRFH